MADNAEIKQLIREGVEAARAGDKAKARDNFKKVTELDENNERAWLWLATVTENAQQKRIYVENVLSINPDNDQAQQMLLQLSSGGGRSNSGGGEIVPGVSRNRAYVIGGSVLAVWLALMVGLVVVGTNRRASQTRTIAATQAVFAAAQATETSIAAQTLQVETDIAATEAADQLVDATATSLSITQTADAGGITIAGRATLPPTFTPTPSVTPLAGFGPTATPFAALPSELFSGMALLSYGGEDRLNVGFYPMVLHQLDNGNQRRLGEFFVLYADLNPANGQELAYTRYYPETFDFGIEISNLAANSVQRIARSWEPVDFLLELEQVNFSPDGSKLTFIAPTSSTNSDEVYFWT